MVSNQLTNDPFYIAFAELLENKKFSFRQLEYKTGLSAAYLSYLKNRPEQYKPTKQNIEVIASALGIKPRYFREYRELRAKEVISEIPKLADVLVNVEEVSDFAEMLDSLKPVPIIGYVPAAGSEEAMNLALGYAPSLVEADFAVIVKGDYLIDSGILDGDVVFVKKSKKAKNGDLVLARCENEVSLRYFYLHDRSCAELKPANQKYESVTTESFEILGIKVGLYRRS